MQLETSFDVDTVDVPDNLVLVAIDGGFCRTIAEALLSYREHKCKANEFRGVPNKAVEALGHQIQQAGHVLAGEEVRKFPKLIEKLVETHDEDESIVSEL